jgi:hypothetical protein
MSDFVLLFQNHKWQIFSRICVLQWFLGVIIPTYAFQTRYEPGLHEK